MSKPELSLPSCSVDLSLHIPGAAHASFTPRPAFELVSHWRRNQWHCIYNFFVYAVCSSHWTQPPWQKEWQTSLIEILSLRSGLFPQGKSVTRIDLGKKKTSAVSNSFLKKKHHYLPNNKRLSFHIPYSAHTLWKIIDKAIMQLQQVSLAFTWTCWMCIIWMCTITVSWTDKLQ